LPAIHGSAQFELAKNAGWDQRRFAAPVHQQFAMFHDGGPALEASWSHPTLKLGRTVIDHPAGLPQRAIASFYAAPTRG